MTFTFTELQSIAHDLRTAAAQYLTDANIADQCNNPRLAEHFRNQARASRQMAERIEQES